MRPTDVRTKLVLPTLIVLAAGAAHARTGRCVLEVHKKTYLDGPCEISINDDKGSFSIGASDKHPSKYFAYVTIDDDGAQGYWNEEPGATHAHSELGALKRDGACWKNDTARVCAYK